LASRRRRRKSIGKVVVDVESRIRRVEKRPGATRLKSNVVTTQKIQSRAVRTKTIAVDAVTPNEADFGVTFVSDTEPTEYLKEGTTWVDPNTGAAAVYDPTAEEFIDLTAVDYTARASADGKNTIYRQDYEPTGGTYALGDVWFDTDDSNKLYRYSTAITATVTNKALTGNSATLTVSAPHSFVVGETITVSGVDATFNGSYTVTATPTALTVRYDKTATNVPSASSGGTITNTAGWKGFALGDGALQNISAGKITAGSLAANVIVTSNLDAGQITTGSLDAARITAGSITATKLSATAIDGKTITGAIIRQAASGTRIEMDAATPGRISFYTSTETYPGILEIGSYSGARTVTISPPNSTNTPSSITLYEESPGLSVARITSQYLYFTASQVGFFSTGSLGMSYSNNVSTIAPIFRNIGIGSALPDAASYGYRGTVFLVT
jgi:hypothetical protein